MEKNHERPKVKNRIFMGIIIPFLVMLIILLLACIINLNSISSSSTSLSSGSSNSGSSSSTSSSSGSSSSGSSSYKSSNPADYDSKGNYKPVESMTQKEKKDELTHMLEDRLH